MKALWIRKLSNFYLFSTEMYCYRQVLSFYCHKKYLFGYHLRVLCLLGGDGILLDTSEVYWGKISYRSAIIALINGRRHPKCEQLFKNALQSSRADNWHRNVAHRRKYFTPCSCFGQTCKETFAYSWFFRLFYPFFVFN